MTLQILKNNIVSIFSGMVEFFSKLFITVSHFKTVPDLVGCSDCVINMSTIHFISFSVLIKLLPFFQLPLELIMPELLSRSPMLYILIHEWQYQKDKSFRICYKYSLIQMTKFKS